MPGDLCSLDLAALQACNAPAFFATPALSGRNASAEVTRARHRCHLPSVSEVPSAPEQAVVQAADCAWALVGNFSRLRRWADAAMPKCRLKAFLKLEVSVYHTYSTISSIRTSVVPCICLASLNRIV